VLFPPDDTASNLNPGNRNDPGFPQSGHGSIKLSVLFNYPRDPESTGAWLLNSSGIILKYT
jgi:hypothetical protein